MSVFDIAIIRRGSFSIKDMLTSFSKPFQYKTILHDINFELNAGEGLGILGRNGSGKSTLLRTMANIVKPFKGTIVCNGTIAPILALGVGLDMELTGYEKYDDCWLYMDWERMNSVPYQSLSFQN